MKIWNYLLINFSPVSKNLSPYLPVLFEFATKTRAPFPEIVYWQQTLPTSQISETSRSGRITATVLALYILPVQHKRYIQFQVQRLYRSRKLIPFLKVKNRKYIGDAVNDLTTLAHCLPDVVYWRVFETPPTHLLTCLNQ